ncbi:MAG: FKBP-type peptidyl-prolyl cis-trans isomerase [Candidatus Azobacteroides sp.]|nr:FKBP-type peptidyl-prolyl cis-trans isomerase [Candidatus Azobacteroides sp.]
MKLSYLLLFVLSFSIAFQSCSKQDSTSAYAEWRQQNEDTIIKIKNDPYFFQATVPHGPGTVYYHQDINEDQGDTLALYTSQVKISYKGSLIDGTVFDDASERITTMNVSDNISGFAIALQNMRRGDKWKVYIPWDLGYGSAGNGTTIPPYSTLIFEIKLIQISKY